MLLNYCVCMQTVSARFHDLDGLVSVPVEPPVGGSTMHQDNIYTYSENHVAPPADYNENNL